MKLSFVILSYKTPHHLRVCLQNISRLRIPFTYEVIVVDNASHDNTLSMVRTQFSWVHILETKKNLGHSVGNNIGIRASKGEFILLMNPDILLHRSKDLENMVSYLENHPQVAILGPKLHNIDGSLQPSCCRPYTFWTPIFRRTFLGKTGIGKKDIARHCMKDFDHQSTIDVPWLLGACLMMRRSALETIGLLDERFFLYFGDYELCDRAHHAGFFVHYFHETHNIFHYHKRESAARRFSFSQLFSYTTRIHLRDWITYLHIKHHA